jgi:hypothetical protein
LEELAPNPVNQIRRSSGPDTSDEKKNYPTINAYSKIELLNILKNKSVFGIFSILSLK